jgi:uncharacterized repeat protein (TIGR03847 family)
MPMELVPDVFTADYTGRPGERTFFLQSRDVSRTFSFLLEKQQVAVLAEKLREMLLAVDATDAVGSLTAERDPEMALRGPIEPEWRVGTIGLAYDETTDRVLIALAPLTEDEEEAEEAVEAPALEDSFRAVLSREQVRTFVVHAQAVVGEGRALCRLCGLPMDPDGHACPASNGHFAPTSS